jgi:outer membrane lipopolysaccharide assembly protein LptE/RlpB
MRRLVLLGLATAFLGLGGCAYRLGPSNGESAGTRSIQVNPFENKTLEPRLIEAVSFALRRQLQQDGTYALDTRNEGDIVLSGTIMSYERRSLSLQSRDALTPRDYRLTLTAQVTARDRVSGRLLLDRELTGHSDIRIGADLASAERQALPLIAADLARNATALLVDGTW